jgi:hypothetical protein
VTQCDAAGECAPRLQRIEQVTGVPIHRSTSPDATLHTIMMRHPYPD